MVKGLDTFRKYFADYEERYVLIGSAACDILFESNDINFRATRDLDMVLIVEALTPEFGEKFWEFIMDAPVYNFINGRLVDESTDLKPFSQHLFLCVFRYF